MTPDHPSDPTPRLTTMPWGPVRWTVEGEGPAMLLLHGVPGSGRDWRWLAPCLAERFTLYRPDLPGYGGTPLPEGADMHVDRRVALILEWVDAIGLRDFALVGHSMGGPLAIRLAGQRPDAVTRLGLLASPGLRPHRGRRIVPDFPTRLMIGSPTRERLTRPLHRLLYRAAGFSSAVPDHEMLHSTQAVLSLEFERLRANAAAVRAPTLMAWAMDDHLVEPAIGEELATALPEGPRLRFESGGHNVQKTRAVELGEALGAWAR